jgi:hypothetical protein
VARISTGELQLLADEGDLAAVRPGQAHAHGLGRGRGRGRAGIDEALPARLHHLGLASARLGVRRALLHLLEEVEEAPLLGVPTREGVAQRLVARRAGLVVRRPAPGVRPGPVALDGDHGVGRRSKQLTVVADEQHGLVRGDEALLEPALARDVEEVVGLVEQEDVRVGAQERFEHEPLALAARDP